MWSRVVRVLQFFCIFQHFPWWEENLVCTYATGLAKVGWASAPHFPSRAQGHGSSWKWLVAMAMRKRAWQWIAQSAVSAWRWQMPLLSPLARAAHTWPHPRSWRCSPITCLRREDWKHLVSSSSDQPDVNKWLHKPLQGTLALRTIIISKDTNMRRPTPAAMTETYSLSSYISFKGEGELTC